MSMKLSMKCHRFLLSDGFTAWRNALECTVVTAYGGYQKERINVEQQMVVFAKES